MHVKKRLSLALKTASEISNKTEDLRGIMEKMSGRQRDIFKDLIKGKHIIKVFIKRGMMRELAQKVPTVTRIDDLVIPVAELKFPDFEDLPPQDKGRLIKGAMDLVGRDYKKFIVDIKWMFKMLSFDAVRTVATIMEDPHVSPQTRLSAAQDILNRGGFEGTKDPVKEHFPVSVVIRYDKKPESDNDNTIIEGESYGANN